MCIKIAKNVRLKSTPLALNIWGEEAETFSSETRGDIIIHRSGDWDFEANVGHEAIRIYATYVSGTPQNFSEFLGEIID